MSTMQLSPLQQDQASGLRYRLRLPAPAAPRALLVLLHGVGANERGIASLSSGVDDDVLVVVPQGPLQLATDQFAWFRVQFLASGPRIEAEEAEHSRQALIELLGQLQSTHAIAPQHTVIAGFSQGGILSASVGLTAPERVSGFAVLSGRILPELAPVLAAPERLRSVRAFIGHGVGDTKLTVDWAHKANALLETLGVDRCVHTYDHGHEVGAQMFADFQAWLAKVITQRAGSAACIPISTSLTSAAIARRACSMNFGIKGKNALVCGASRGLGRGCADALAAEGVNLVMLARSAEPLELAAEQIRSATGVNVVAIACDVTTPQGRAAALAACPAADMLVTNAAGPPPGDFRDFSHQDWLKAVENNMLAPIALIREVIDGMVERRFGRIVNITSSAVKAPIENLSLSNGARAGLTGAVSALARQVARHNVTINNLLPGLFDTDRMKALVEARAQAARVAVDEIRTRQLQGIPAGRYGNSAEFGAACAYLCSEQASFITAQNWVIDGGAYAGAL